MKRHVASALIGCASLSLSFVMPVQANESWPLYKVDGDKRSKVEFEPVSQTTKKWKVCVLLPHVKDSYWVGVDYGVVEEAKRLGASVKVFEAGGYDNLAKQVSQYDDCLAAKSDAIIIGAISEVGLAQKLKESMSKGIPTISFINPIRDTEITSKIFVDFFGKGEATGKFLLELIGPSGGKVATFPGPQGSGWAETYQAGFEAAVKDSPVTVVGPKFGDTGAVTQLQLVEDTLQSDPDIVGIWGHPTAVQGAVGALEEAGLENIKTVTNGENTEVIQLVKEGKIDGVGVESPVLMARVAFNSAIRALEGGEVHPYYEPIPDMLTPQNEANYDLTTIIAPPGFQPVFTME